MPDDDALEVEGAAGSPRAFISYSHDSEEHRLKALALADRLREDGVNAILDQYEVEPPRGWSEWTVRQLEDSDFIVVVVSDQYRKRFEGEEISGEARPGANWEAAILDQDIVGKESSEKLVPVIFGDAEMSSVPLALRSHTLYRLGEHWEGYDSLYRRLTSQPMVTPPPVGEVRLLSSPERLGFSSYPQEEQKGEKEDSRGLYSTWISASAVGIGVVTLLGGLIPEPIFGLVVGALASFISVGVARVLNASLRRQREGE